VTAAVAAPLPVAEADNPLSGETPATPDELSYPERLRREGLPVETLQPTPIPDDPPALSEPTPTAPAVSAEAPSLAEPVRAGFAVQVAALRARGAADAIVRRLVGKGYPADLLAPAQDAPATVYRVRVGTYTNRSEAEEVASRLEREERFKPWIIR
jgi:cell division septation protein DedD